MATSSITSALDGQNVALRCDSKYICRFDGCAAATQRSQERDQFVGCLNFVGDSLRWPHRAFNALGTARARHSGISKSLRPTDRQTFRLFPCAARSRRPSGKTQCHSMIPSNNKSDFLIKARQHRTNCVPLSCLSLEKCLSLDRRRSVGLFASCAAASAAVLPLAINAADVILLLTQSCC